MPGYVAKQCKKYKHDKLTRQQNTPLQPAARTYGADTHKPTLADESPKLPPEKHRFVQQVVGSFLYYGRTLDPLILHALSVLASEQANAMENTLKRVHQFLDYMTWHPNATICYYSSDMVLNVHSDASYLTAPRSQSRAGGHYFLGSIPINNKPIQLNGTIHSLCVILKFIATSAAEAELGALFMNAKEAKNMRLTLHELGHAQLSTPIHIDNTTVVGIVNSTIKRQRSRAMEMRYFWLLDSEVQ